MAHQLPIHSSQTFLQAARQSQLNPHAQENGCRIEEQPTDPEGKQCHALQSREEQRQQHSECEQYPTDKDALIANVVHGEAVIVHQRLHGIHIVLYR